MNMSNFGRVALQLRIGLIHAGAIPCLIAMLLMLGAGTWLWLAAQAQSQTREAQEHALAQARQAVQALKENPDAVAVAHNSVAEQHLERFYAVLGEPAEAELHLKTLFAIAAKLDIQLDQGEYQWAFDKHSRVYRHQILLPVKGPYRQIRQFCEQTLLTLPFASLDELSFKRESIDEDEPDGSLRLTFFLKDAPRVRPAVAADKS